MKFLIATAVLAYFLVAWVPFVLLSGCAARQIRIGPQVVIPRHCMDKIEMTNATVCRGPADNLTAPHCTALRLTYRPKCAGITVEAKPK